MMPALVPDRQCTGWCPTFPGKGRASYSLLDEMTAKLVLVVQSAVPLSFVVAGLLS